MKRLFKWLLMAMAIGWLGQPTLQGQQYGVMTSAGGAGYTIAGNTSSNVALVLGSAKFDQVVLEITNHLHSAGTSNLTVTWSTSTDGLVYANTGPGQGSFTFGPSTGTTPVVFLTNMTLNSIAYWRLDTLSNGNVAIMTNWSIRAFCKPRRQG